ncbi:MAG: hypothetical protein JSV79_12575 [Armatimonadota bacterium]|nr:MAG: hypothetical protein JSV79_12575 [Armatimonadota bacterium]
MLPTIRIADKQVTRLICGGNPISGISHYSAEMDEDMLHYYTMPRLQALLDECWRQGINTVQTRGDRHTMRMYMEHRDNGGHLQWIAQTASEFVDVYANIARIAHFGPIAIYHHGTHTDNSWHAGEIDKVHDFLKAIHDHGLPAGLGTHIPEVVEYAEEKGWETDFYMSCLYDLARGYKTAPAAEQDAYARDRFPDGDPERMTAVMREVPKPCLGFKIMAANRKCSTPQSVKQAFEYAFANIKSTDGVVVGMFPKYRNQVEENARFVREILSQQAE